MCQPIKAKSRPVQPSAVLGARFDDWTHLYRCCWRSKRCFFTCQSAEVQRARSIRDVWLRTRRPGYHFPPNYLTTCRLGCHSPAGLCTRANTFTTRADCHNDSNRASPMTDNRMALWPQADKEGNRETDFQDALFVPQLKVLICQGCNRAGEGNFSPIKSV